MRRALLMTAVALAVPAAGCGGSDTEGARKAAEAYVARLGAGDGKGTCDLMTPELQRRFTQTVAATAPQFKGKACAEIMQLALNTIPRSQLQEFSKAKISDVRVDGDRGSFRYTLRQIEVGGKVAKVDGDWRVSCCVPGQGGG